MAAHGVNFEFAAAKMLNSTAQNFALPRSQLSGKKTMLRKSGK
jgi:hypothetical protein